MPPAAARLRVVGVVLLVFAAGSAMADPAVPGRGSLLATGAAIVPGALLHGSGHFVLGDRKSALRLVILEAAGLAGGVGGIGMLAAVGGSDKLAPVYVPLSVGGVAAFTLSFFADILGATRGAEPWPVPRHLGPGMRGSLGWISLFAMPFAVGHAAQARLAWRATAHAAEASVTVAPLGELVGGGAAVSRRLFAAADDAISSVWLVFGLRHLALRADGVRMTTAESFLESRWNLGGLAPTLRNAWVLGRLGVGLDLFGYPARGSFAEDALPLLVVDAGMGVQLHERVAIELAYRHRKDELPGGFSGSGTAGFLGFVEATGRATITDRWTVVPAVRWGRGVLTCIALESRF